MSMSNDRKTVHLEIGADEYKRIKQLADDAGRSINDLVLEAFDLLIQHYEQSEAEEEMSGRDAAIEASRFWTEVLIERDIPDLLECRRKDEVVNVLGEYFDQLDFDVWPYNAIDPMKLQTHLTAVREHFIQEGLTHWELELQDAEA
mgnify:CR=1 FL=1